MHTRRPTGFTLIEMVATLAILALLAATAFPVADLVAKRAKEQELRYNLRQIRDGLDAYKRAAEEGRIARKANDSGYPANLDLLASGVEDQRSPLPNKPKIYFLRRIPADPMAAPGVTGSASWGKRSYASPPEEPKEGDDVYDVYSLSEYKGINGVPYRQW